jgi:helix-turn-helix protein
MRQRLRFLSDGLLLAAAQLGGMVTCKGQFERGKSRVASRSLSGDAYPKTVSAARDEIRTHL